MNVLQALVMGITLAAFADFIYDVETKRGEVRVADGLQPRTDKDGFIPLNRKTISFAMKQL